MIKAQTKFIAHDRRHEIFNNYRPLPINIVDKIANSCPHIEILLDFKFD